MCVDVVQYFKMMECDEDGIFDCLKVYWSIMFVLMEWYDGWIVNIWGDVVIVEFGFVIDVVQCVVEIQNEFFYKNVDLLDLSCMEFCIGLNFGDIMIEGDDIYGDGVNVVV